MDGVEFPDAFDVPWTGPHPDDASPYSPPSPQYKEHIIDALQYACTTEVESCSRKLRDLWTRVTQGITDHSGFLYSLWYVTTLKKLRGLRDAHHGLEEDLKKVEEAVKSEIELCNQQECIDMRPDNVRARFVGIREEILKKLSEYDKIVDEGE